MAEAAAGVNADRQAVAFRRAVDRPVLPPAQREFGLRQHQHLDEALVLGAAVDLLGGELRAVHRHDDGCAQPRIAIQPFRGDPPVDRTAQRRPTGPRCAVIAAPFSTLQMANRVWNVSSTCDCISPEVGARHAASAGRQSGRLLSGADEG